LSRLAISRARERAKPSKARTDRLMAMDRFPSKITRRRALQALASVALCGGAGTLHGEPAGKAREQLPWLTLPPTPELPQPDRSGIAEVNGTRLFYAQFGQGEPVLLLHEASAARTIGATRSRASPGAMR
jgi:hypothetical protein